MTFNAYMHERNIYRNKPNFTQIALDFPEFRTYAIPDAKGEKVRVDFTNPDALRCLTKILLKKDFNLDVEIPEGFLIPTVPQRLNYILWLEDLLCNIPKREECARGIDIGTGPCAIFALLGAQKNGWKFIATESSADAIFWAEKNINKNNLIKNITIVKVSEGSALNEILSKDNEIYDFCLCNPPFFENIKEIRQKHQNTNETIADAAQEKEIFVKGGELEFVKNILKDSLIHKDRISLFTSMFGKKKSLLQFVSEIEKIEDIKFITTEFCQGNTIRWGIAWTFSKSIYFEKQDKKKIKPKKIKPPLEYQIPLKESQNATFETIVNQIKNFLNVLQIPVIQKRTSKYFVELLLKSDKNTWSHQRRKRRELKRKEKNADSLEEKHSSTEIGLFSSKNSNSTENVFSFVAKEPFENADSVKNINSKNEMDKKEINLENDQMCDASNNFSKNINSNNATLLNNNKRKSDSVSEDLYINKKTCLDENFIDSSTNDSSNILSENTKNSQNVENISTKMDTCNDVNKTDTEEVNSIQFENNSNDILLMKNPSNCEKVSLKKSNEFLLNKESFHSSSTKNIEKSCAQEQGLIIDCYLQIIKGKNKIYVKMNCSITADRNVMYQVFQLIRNKIK